MKKLYIVRAGLLAIALAPMGLRAMENADLSAAIHEGDVEKVQALLKSIPASKLLALLTSAIQGANEDHRAEVVEAVVEEIHDKGVVVDKEHLEAAVNAADSDPEVVRVVADAAPDAVVEAALREELASDNPSRETVEALAQTLPDADVKELLTEELAKPTPDADVAGGLSAALPDHEVVDVIEAELKQPANQQADVEVIKEMVDTLSNQSQKQLADEVAATGDVHDAQVLVHADIIATPALTKLAGPNTKRLARNVSRTVAVDKRKVAQKQTINRKKVQKAQRKNVASAKSTRAALLSRKQK